MKKEEFHYLWETCVKPNSNWNYLAKQTKTFLLYYDTLKGFDKEILHEAIIRLQDSEEGAKGLPSLGNFLDYCRWVQDDRKQGKRPNQDKYCPCCDNSGWRYIKIKGEVFVTSCDCRKGGGVKECKNGDYCNLSDPSICPMGARFYQGIQSQKIERLQQDPDYKLGKEMLRGFGLKKLEDIAKKIAEELPF